MLQYLKHHEIDYAEWDRCLESSPNAIIYGFTWYLDIVAPGWHAIVKKENRKYVAIMPIPVFKKFGIAVVRQPIFAQQLGVFHQEPITITEWEEFGRLLQKNFRVISSYEFNTGNTKNIGDYLKHIEKDVLKNLYLDLNHSYLEINAKYNLNRRRQLGNSKRAKLEIQRANSIEPLITIFKKYTAPSIEGIIGDSYEYLLLRKIYDEVKNRGMGEVYEALDNQKPIALIFILKFKGHFIYLLGASTPLGKKIGAITFLIDSIISKYAGGGGMFDFENPQVDNLIKFYKSFGSAPAYFLSVKANNLPTPLKWVQQLRYRAYQFFKNKSVSNN